MNKILKSLLLQTCKPGKDKGNPCRKDAKNAAAGGSQANGKNKPKKRPTKGASKPATDSNYKKGIGVKANKTNSQALCKFNLELVNQYLIYSCVKDVELGLIELSPLCLAMLIGQMVYIYNLWLSLCLLQASNERLLSISCLKNWEFKLSHCVYSYELC